MYTFPFDNGILRCTSNFMIQQIISHSVHDLWLVSCNHLVPQNNLGLVFSLSNGLIGSQKLLYKWNTIISTILTLKPWDLCCNFPITSCQRLYIMSLSDISSAIEYAGLPNNRVTDQPIYSQDLLQKLILIQTSLKLKESSKNFARSVIQQGIRTRYPNLVFFPPQSKEAQLIFFVLNEWKKSNIFVTSYTSLIKTIIILLETLLMCQVLDFLQGLSRISCMHLFF